MEKRTELVNFRVSSQERRLLKEVAKDLQTTQSAILRDAIYRAVAQSLASAGRQQQVEAK